jgi:hypothetical protein
MDQNEIQRRAQLVQQAAEAKFGKETIDAGINAMASRGIDQEQLVRALSQPDAHDKIYMMGRDALISAADSDPVAAARLSDIRAEERERYRRGKNR